MAEPDEDPEQVLRRVFLRMGFLETEASKLAEARADPLTIGWWLEQGCSPRLAVEIAT